MATPVFPWVKMETAYELAMIFTPEAGEEGGWRLAPLSDFVYRAPDGSAEAPADHLAKCEEVLDSIGTDQMREWKSKPVEVGRVDEMINEHVVRTGTKEMTFIETTVDQRATWVLEGLDKGSPCWSFDRLDDAEWKETVVQLCVTYLGALQQVPGDTLKKKCRGFETMLRFHRQKKTLYVAGLEEDAEKIHIRYRITAELAPYEKGRLCYCIPIPGKEPKRQATGCEPRSVRSPEIVLASPLVEEDVTRVSSVWQDRSAKSVLVCGPPGCGKENLAHSIVYGSGRNVESMQTLALGECDDIQSLKRLFGWRKSDGVIENGAIARAKGSALFVDEAHYPPDRAGVRGALLRTLEAGKYYPVDADHSRDVENVLWIFASSRALTGPDSIGKVPPEDFWTRMSHAVPVRHALDATALLHTQEMPSPHYSRRRLTSKGFR